MYSIEVDDGVERIEASPLPFLYLWEYLVGDITDQVFTDFSSVNIQYVFLNICCGESEAVHIDNFLFHLIGSSLKFWDDFRFKFSIPVSWNFDLDIPIFCEKFLLVAPISGVTGVISRFLVFLVSKMLVHFRLEHLSYERSGTVFEERIEFLVSGHLSECIFERKSLQFIQIEITEIFGFCVVCHMCKYEKIKTDNFFIYIRL